MFWKAVALFGAGSFFFVGWGVLTDPLCNSVSFRGGGARTVVTTCFPDSSGDFSRASAVTGSFLIGLAILAILFWPLIKVYPGGVALPGAINSGGAIKKERKYDKALYNANKKSDRDKDGIACEK